MTAASGSGLDASGPGGFPRAVAVDARAPLRWLARGWRDLVTGPGLFYGIAFVAMSWSLQAYLADQPHVTLALGTGFALIGPFLALGLYDLSQQRERGAAADLLPSLRAWKRNPGAIGLYAIILMLLLAAWIRVSVVLVALFYQGAMPTATSFLKNLVFSGDNLGFLAVYFGVGALFALLVFSVSVVSLPLMLDRGTDTITAMIASCLVIARNPMAMILWALLLGLLILAGLVTWYFALLVTGPLVGHASWHAYRDVIAHD